MKKITVMSTVAVLGLSSAALADGAEAWQGFYLGGTINSFDAEYSVTPTFDSSGMNLGIVAGYTHAVGSNFVVGAELNYSPGENTEASLPGNPVISDALSLRVRAGYAAEDFMFYAGAGALQADFSIPGVTQNLDGTQMFLGAEMRVSDRISARIEYSTATMDTPLYGPGQDVDFSGLSLGIMFGF